MVRLLVVFAVVVVLVGVFFVSRPVPRTAGSRERTLEVFVGVGDRVRLEVDAAVPVELHLRGHGVELEAGSGDVAVTALEAGLSGRFGIEDHRSEREVGVLVVGTR